MAKLKVMVMIMVVVVAMVMRTTAIADGAGEASMTRESGSLRHSGPSTGNWAWKLEVAGR